MIGIFSKSNQIKDKKILLANITHQFLDKGIHLDKAEISGKEIRIYPSNKKKAIIILKKIYGIERIIFQGKEIQGKGGLPKGSRGKVFLDVKKYEKFARRMGFEIVKKDFDAVVTNNVKKFKKKGILSLDFSYCSIL